jgi:hypothetical protein
MQVCSCIGTVVFNSFVFKFETIVMTAVELLGTIQRQDNSRLVVWLEFLLLCAI